MANPDLLTRALAAIDPSVSNVKEFQAISSLQSRQVARNVLEFFTSQGIGKIANREISFSGTDRIKAAVICIKRGADVRQVSVRLSWQDFEKLASEILGSFDYSTRTNVRFVKPRMEIDVVGQRSSRALVIDCKHWKNNNLSAISKHSQKQAARALRLAELDRRIRQAIPVMLTLHAESVKFVERIPIVPIAQFQSFISELDSYIPDLCVIRAHERTSIAM